MGKIFETVLNRRSRDLEKQVVIETKSRQREAFKFYNIWKATSKKESYQNFLIHYGQWSSLWNVLNVQFGTSYALTVTKKPNIDLFIKNSP